MDFSSDSQPESSTANSFSALLTIHTFGCIFNNVLPNCFHLFKQIGLVSKCLRDLNLNDCFQSFLLLLFFRPKILCVMLCVLVAWLYYQLTVCVFSVRDLKEGLLRTQIYTNSLH